MTKDEALKMAIEAMTLPNNLSFLMAITACKEALEQPSVAELNDQYLHDTYVEGLSQPKEPDFDATEYQRALKKSAQKFKEKIERTYAEVLDKAINELAQPKKPQYLYVCKSEAGYLSSSLEPIVNTGWKYIGKIKLEVNND